MNEIMKAYEELEATYNPTGQEKKEEGITAPPLNQIQRAFSLLDTLDIPPQKWIVEDIIPEASVNVLYSSAGVGKTFIAPYLCMCVATGKPWLGHPVIQSPILWVDGDMGHQNCMRRLRMIAKGIDINLQSKTFDDDLIKNTHIMTAQTWKPNGMEQPNLYTGTGLDRIQAYVQTYGIGVTVFDTMRMFTMGMRENDSDQVSDMFHRLKNFRDETGCSVLLLHHANKGGAQWRGSTDIPCDIDLMLSLEKNKDTGEYIIQTPKMRLSSDQSVCYYMNFSGEKDDPIVTFTQSAITEQEEKVSRLESLRNQVMDAIKTNNGINRTNLLTALNIKRKSQREDELDTVLAQLLADQIIKVNVTGNRNRKYSLL